MENGKTEKMFRDEVVLPYLIKEGHEILRVEQTSGFISVRSGTVLNPVVDISSVFQGVVYISEIKVKASLGHIYTVLGQLMIHQFIYRSLGYNEVKYQMIFPSRALGVHMLTNEFLKYLQEFNIDTLLL